MVVQGWDGGGWIYRAVIVDVASALLSQLVLEVVGFPGQSACEVCLGRLNSATRAEFEETGHVDAALAEAMLAVRPFSLKSCEGAHTIELLLANIQGIDEAQGKRIVMCFCPELYE